MIGPNCVHLGTFFTLNQASVIGSLLGLHLLLFQCETELPKDFIIYFVLIKLSRHSVNIKVHKVTQ